MSKKKFEIDFNITQALYTKVHNNTHTYFDRTFCESSNSPIDSFFEKIKEFNILVQNISTDKKLNSELKVTTYNLILLGQVSAVESYMREIIRKLIIVDKFSYDICSTHELSFSAAMNYNREILPEALMEKHSFANKYNIISALKDFLGISKGITVEIENVLNDFNKVCHLRHCMIHRFGKLGSNNAIRLGIDKHVDCLEKPLNLDDKNLLDTYNACSNLIVSINNFLFKKILTRTVENEIWSWDYRKDRKEFTQYFQLFVSNTYPDVLIKNDVKVCYEHMRTTYKTFSKKQKASK